MRTSDEKTGAGRLGGILGALPSVGAFLLPLGKCPACWPAYAALLSSLGVGFLFYERYVLPLAVAVVALGLGSLAHRASSRRGYGPFWLALAGALVALAGKFLLPSSELLYGGLVLYVVAAGWNAWPRRLSSCAGCTQQEDGVSVTECTR